MARKKLIQKWIRVLLLVGLFSGACNLLNLQPDEGATPLPTISSISDVTPITEISDTISTPFIPTDTPEPPIPLSPGPRFANYREIGVQVAPLLHHEMIAPDLNNVTIPFALSESQLERLKTIGFVVSPGVEKEFFTLYEKARYDNLPVFVTSDSLLHVYHLMFSKVLRTAEVVHFIPMLRSLNQALLIKADEQYQQLQGSQWDDAARRTVAYIGVASLILDPQAQIPPYAFDLVQAEINLINAAAGIQLSPLFPGLENGEDYTQYIPRGHYTKSEELKSYFKAMMWYGRMTFRLQTDNPEVGKAETRSAILLVKALRDAVVDARPAIDLWAELYSSTVFFVGRSDDLTVIQYGDVMDHVYGSNVNLASFLDDEKLDQFIQIGNQLPPPRILGIVIQDSDDEERTTKGMRFMGQRFVPDAYIFRQLIYRNVGTREHRRGLPKGLDLFAAMGSSRAFSILDQSGDTSYENYSNQMEKVKSWLSGLSVDEWTETLYNTWLYTFFPLLEEYGEGFPSFMRNQAWQDKQLNTSLGSWAELKHDTILYAKQVYAELGGGPPPPPPLPPKGYVEPVPMFYARLQALTEMTRTGLETRGLLTEEDQQGLLRLEDLAQDLHTIAGKELRGEPLSEEQFERIRYYGGELETLTMLSAETEEEPQPGGEFMAEEQQAAVIADVATDPDPAGTGGSTPQVLEVGVGRINEIHAIVPIVEADGSISLRVAKGGVFSYYEFRWPADNRLTDEAWRKMLDEHQAPPLQDWADSFFVTEGEYNAIGQGVTSFQSGITWLYWDALNMLNYLEPTQEIFRPDLEALVKQKQYVGHQLVSSSFRSFDLQTDIIAVVTVREVWQDKLYSYTEDFPNYNEPMIAQKGPYSLDVTYTLEFVQEDWGSFWRVIKIIYSNNPPSW